MCPSAADGLEGLDRIVPTDDAAPARSARARGRRRNVVVVVPLVNHIRQALLTVVGFTHASSVMPAVRRSEAASLTSTRALVPSNAKAPPYLPAVVQAAAPIVPVFPLPDARRRSSRLLIERIRRDKARAPAGVVAFATFE